MEESGWVENIYRCYVTQDYIKKCILKVFKHGMWGGGRATHGSIWFKYVIKSAPSQKLKLRLWYTV